MSAPERAVRKARGLCNDNKSVAFGLAAAVLVGFAFWRSGLLQDSHGGPLPASHGSQTQRAAPGSSHSQARAERSAAAADGGGGGFGVMGAFDAVRCGSTGPDAWHLKYAELHRRILSGRAPQRYMVAQGWEGLADSIVGAVTVFWMALLSDRAFQMTPTNWHGNSVRYEWMYAQPFINWTQTEADDPDSLRFQLDPNNHKEWEWQDRVKCGNYSMIGSDVRTVTVITNLGFSVGLFDNPFYREQMFALGLRPETAYGCAYDFLLYPQSKLFEEHTREYETLTRPGPLKIGVQIRAGDHRMEEGAVHLAMFEHFFDCASQIERDYRLHGQEVLWFLITDSTTLRREAREKYGDKLLTASPNMTATHFLHEKGNTPSLRAAAMDQWLFGLADFHVISRLSGYGRTGGWRSRRWHGIYTLENHRTEYRDCSAGAWDSVKALAALGDGMWIGNWHPGI